MASSFSGEGRETERLSNLQQSVSLGLPRVSARQQRSPPTRGGSASRPSRFTCIVGTRAADGTFTHLQPQLDRALSLCKPGGNSRGWWTCENWELAQGPQLTEGSLDF